MQVLATPAMAKAVAGNRSFAFMLSESRARRCAVLRGSVAWKLLRRRCASLAKRRKGRTRVLGSSGLAVYFYYFFIIYSGRGETLSDA